jgi:hypothetical protein
MYPDWTRLMDFAKKMETRGQGSESCGPALCQQEYDPRPFKPCVDQSLSHGGCFPLPTTRIDFTGGETLVSTLTNKELDRK